MKTPACIKRWIRKGRPLEVIKARCLVCGAFTRFDSYEPVDLPCKRNTFFCRCCGSIARNRHLAKVILETFDDLSPDGFLGRFAAHTIVAILNTCASGALHNALKWARNYQVSEYYEGVPSGATVNGVMCQNLEETSFDEDSFELIITEDVLEHISRPERALAEIRRILRPGGYHIATIPVFWDRAASTTRAVFRNGQLIHVLAPEYHHDPNRTGGILMFTDFGRDLAERYCSIVGPTTVHASNADTIEETTYAIYNNWVFSSRKEPAQGTIN